MEESISYINQNGTKIWYLLSKGPYHWHRVDGPALEAANGEKHYYQHGELHRVDGPAIGNEWWSEGKRHRLNGPAWDESTGPAAWYINGKHIKTEVMEKWMDENGISMPLSDEDIMAVKLWWV